MSITATIKLLIQFHLMSQMNEHRGNGLNMCSIKSPDASKHMMFDVHYNDDYAIYRFNHVKSLSSCSQDFINLIFSNQYYIRSPYLICGCYCMRRHQKWGTVAAVE